MALKILVVDDEPGISKLIKTIVEPLGVEILALTDSREAAQRLKTEKYDGVILDAHMPHLDGFALSRQVRTSSFNTTVPIVMITGHDDVETMRHSFKSGVTFFLGKPITVEKVQGLFKASRGLMLREKRRYARLPLRTSVDCTLGETTFKASSLNIGEGGMLLQSWVVLELGQELEMQFPVPQSGSPVKVRARVQRKEGEGRAAVRFIDLSPEDLEAIREYISGGVK